MVTRLSPAVLATLTGGCGRGFTALCTIPDVELLDALASIAGQTGLVLALGCEPPVGRSWSAVRCDPAEAIPLRSHIIDAAVLVATPDLSLVAGEVRRTLVPGGDVRVLLACDADAATALADHSIRTLRVEPCGVLVGRGPGA